jgi:DNA-binding transcriptional ArsR family regulator
MTKSAATVQVIEDVEDPGEELLDRVFFALSDPVRRAILQRVSEEALLVSELAAPFDISLQAVSRHIQVLVRAGLVRQERTGRISRCSLVAGPVFAAAVWINRYSKYWQDQFDLLAVTLESIEQRRARKRPPAARARRGRTAPRR